MLVDRLVLPLLLKLLVKMGVHWLNGAATLVEPSKTYDPLCTPFVALRFNVVPLTLMLVIRGCGVRSRICRRLSMMPGDILKLWSFLFATNVPTIYCPGAPSPMATGAELLTPAVNVDVPD